MPHTSTPASERLSEHGLEKALGPGIDCKKGRIDRQAQSLRKTGSTFVPSGQASRSPAWLILITLSSRLRVTAKRLTGGSSVGLESLGTKDSSSRLGRGLPTRSQALAQHHGQLRGSCGAGPRASQRCGHWPGWLTGARGFLVLPCRGLHLSKQAGPPGQGPTILWVLCLREHACLNWVG